MPTNKELEFEVQQLKERVGRLQVSNSRIRDEFAELKTHYTKLVEGLNTRFEDMHDNFFRNSQ